MSIRIALTLFTCSLLGCAQSEPPQPVFNLPEPSGWMRTLPRALPPREAGFSVAYEHSSGITVTFFQFTRGLKTIPDDLNSPQVRGELQNAKDAILEAARLGFWDDATETETGRAQLGGSGRNVLWSRFALTVNGEQVASDTYCWAHKNTLFKLRCTGQLEDSAALKSLLTSFGEACSD